MSEAFKRKLFRNCIENLTPLDGKRAMTEAKGSDVRMACEEAMHEINYHAFDPAYDWPQYVDIIERHIASLIEARVQAAIGDEKLNPWKQAIIEALVVNFILSKANENDPKKALADLIGWNTKLALDPRVSSNAAALEQAAAVEMRERCAKAICWACAERIPKLTNGQHEHTPEDDYDDYKEIHCHAKAILSVSALTDALDAMLREARLEEHLAMCQEVTCADGLPLSESRCNRRKIMAALTQPAPEKGQK